MATHRQWPVDIDSRIVELLRRHEELQAQGCPVPPEELCRDCPELLDAFREHCRCTPPLGSLPAEKETTPRTLSYPNDVATDTVAPAVDTAATGHASAGRLPPGLAALPGYEVLAELGRGGMGVVYKARQIKADRIVALKMMLAGAHADNAERARFRTEAEAIARLQHPNIVQVFEVGEHVGLPFFSLEYCSGGSLARKLNGTPLPAEEAAHVVELLARAMQAAHEQQVIHRDLKPANVLLGEDGTPKITDFGLARKLDDVGQTRTGAIMGSPSYMAPEQAAGRTRDISVLTDVYALGATLYECLTGRPPFTGPGIDDIVHRVCHEEPVAVRQLQPGCPRELETICLKCLQKEQGKRYTSALDLAEDLRRFLAGEPIRARPVGSFERGWRWCRRNPLAAGLLLAVFLTLALGAGTATYFAIRAEDARQREERRADSEREAKESAETALAVAEFEKAKANFVAYSFQLDAARQSIERGRLGEALDRLAVTDPNLRHWEHAYLTQLARRCRWTGRQHGKATAVCFSPDGRHVATGGEDALVRVWDADTGREIRTLKKHMAPIHGVSYSLDGKRIVSAGGRDDRVKVWDAHSGKEELDIQCPAQGVLSARFSPDGNHIVSGHSDATARVWDARTGQQRLALVGHAGWVMSACFSPDGRWIATAGQDQLVKLWEATSGKESRTLRGHTDIVRVVCFSPDGQRLATGSGDTTLRLWDTATGRTTHTLHGHLAAVSGVNFSADGSRIVSGSHGTGETRLRVWDASTGLDLLTLRGHTGAVLDAAISSDGNRVVSGGADGTVKVWDVRLDLGPRTLPVRTSGRSNVCFSPDGTRIIVTGDQNRVQVCDAQTGRGCFTCTGTASAGQCICYSPDGRWIAAVTKDRSIARWDAATGQETSPIGKHMSDPVCVCYSPDGKQLAAGGTDGVIQVWDANTGREIVTLRGTTPGTATCAVYSPDGRYLVSGGASKQVTVWDVSAGEVVHTLQGHTHGIHAVCVSPDAKRIASGGDDNQVLVWDLQTGERIFSLQGHAREVRSLCYSPDGRRLASGSADKTVKLWDACTGKEAFTLRAGPGGVSSVCFSPDGQRIAARTFDWKLKVWDALPP